MKVLIIVALLASTLAQNTTKKPGFLDGIANSFSSTLSALGDALETYLKQEGQHLLHEVLPSVGGSALFSGLFGLIDAAIHPKHPTTPAATEKRDVVQSVEAVVKNIEGEIQKAVSRAGGVKNAINALLEGLFTGTINPEQYLAHLPLLKPVVEDIFNKLNAGVLNEVSKLMGPNKRDLDISTILNALKNLQTQGLSLFESVTHVLSALGNPANLAAVIQQLAAELHIPNLAQLLQLVG